jgi:hypothetical protein
LPVRIDCPIRRSAQFADLGNLAALDADIAPKRRHARTVDNAAILDQQIVRHRHSPCGG